MKIQDMSRDEILDAKWEHRELPPAPTYCGSCEAPIDEYTGWNYSDEPPCGRYSKEHQKYMCRDCYNYWTGYRAGQRNARRYG